MVSFYLTGNPSQIPTNEQIINGLKTLIDKQTLNLIDPNRRLLHPIAGSLVIGTCIEKKDIAYREIDLGSKDEAINVKLFSLPHGDYMGEFTPKKVGRYRIDITFNNKLIDGSSFLTEVYDPNEVKISSLSKDIQVGIESYFEIDTSKVEKVPIEVMILSPTGKQSKERG